MDVKVGGITLGNNLPIVLIAGPCVIESEQHCLEMAKKLKELTSRLDIPFIFKTSYDKANRSSIKSFRGPGLKKGLEILKKIKKETGAPILTDIHSIEQINPVAEIADILQIPAFLSRQTDLILDAAKTGKVVNVKKGQFLAPADIENVIEKIESAGNRSILITERGVSFGYNNLVVDMRSLVIIKKFGYPVIFDATHSVQLPGGLKTCSGGEKEFIEPLSSAAAAIGIAGLFLEVHDNPEKALCDGPNMINIKELENLLRKIKKLDNLAKRN
jgi:2-dehydro-3-deoxyphosphooctonate aldolase (KDO 8-P synthase)